MIEKCIKKTIDTLKCININIDNFCKITLNKDTFKDYKKYKNEIVKIDDKIGVYIIANNLNEIVYVGAAGKFDNKINKLNSHFISKRLKASRYKDKSEKNKNNKPKDISTFSWLKTYFFSCPNIQELFIYAIYTEKNILPCFLEAFLLQIFYNKK